MSRIAYPNVVLPDINLLIYRAKIIMPRLKIREKFWETKEACSFYFENLDGNTLFYKPGQFLTLILSINEKEVKRSYSLCTVPVKDKYPGITVKRIEGGVVSNYLLDHAKEGDIIECDYPAGIFVSDTNPSAKLHYFLIAAGSGITPLYSMLQTILHKENLSTISLIYSNRDENSIIYKDKLEVFDFQHGERLQVVHVLSSPSSNWSGFKDRLHPELLKNLIQQLETHKKEDTRFFLCGPQAFMQMAQETILSIGYTTDHIKKETYNANTLLPQKEAVPSHSISALNKSATIFYRNEEYTFEVPENETILKAAINNGIRLPYSCQNGVCTACMGMCKEGKVDVSRAEALTDKEKDLGNVLICVGRPLTQHVVIQID